MLPAFSVRINGGPPVALPFTASNGPIDFSAAFGAVTKRYNSIYFPHRIEDFTRLQGLSVQINDVCQLEASQAYQVALYTTSINPIVLGTLTCTTPSIGGNAPDVLRVLKQDATVYVVVHEVEPPLGWKSAGELFEKFQEQMVTRWRVQFMTRVQAQISASGDVNRQLLLPDVLPVIQQLHGNVTPDFEGSVQSLDL